MVATTGAFSAGPIGMSSSIGPTPGNTRTLLSSTSSSSVEVTGALAAEPIGISSSTGPTPGNTWRLLSRAGPSPPEGATGPPGAARAVHHGPLRDGSPCHPTTRLCWYGDCIQLVSIRDNN